MLWLSSAKKAWWLDQDQDNIKDHGTFCCGEDGIV
jgi:hypothetical protein